MDIDIEARDQLQSELIDKEVFLWVGRPKRRLVFGLADVPLTIFALIWCWLIFNAIIKTNSDPIIYFIGPVFLLVGFFIGFGRLVWEREVRRSTIYGITSKEIIIRSGIFSKELSRYNIKSIPKFDITEKDDGWGTITLNTDTSWLGRNGIRLRGAPSLPSLTLINNMREVYDLILKLRSN